MSRAIVFIYDTDEENLKGSLALLRHHGVEAAGFALRPYRNRVELLNAIVDTGATPSIALIDLVEEHRLDEQFPGYRLIEAIRRHPELATRCRPVALTAHPYERKDGYRRRGVSELVAEAGGYGLIVRTKLEAMEPDEVDLPSALARISSTRAQTLAVPHEEFLRVPPLQDRDHAPVKAPDVAGGSWFTQDPRLTDMDWAIFRYLASLCDPESIARWMAEDWHMFQKTIKNRIDRLGELASPRYRARGRDLERLAQDLLRGFPEMMAPRSTEEELRTLYRLDEIGELVDDDRVVTNSWIDSEARTVVSAVSKRIAKSHSRAGHAPRLKEVQKAIQTVADDSGRDPESIERALVRGAHGLYETWETLQEPDESMGRDRLQLEWAVGGSHRDVQSSVSHDHG